MIPSLLLICAVLGQSEPLPGSLLSIAQAKEEASYIVAAEVVRFGDVLSGPEMSIVNWTELKPTLQIKGKADAETLNKLPLAFRSEKPERLPKVGEELIFFVAGSGRQYNISKILRKSPENLAAIKAAEPLLHSYPGGSPGGFGGPTLHVFGPLPRHEPKEWKPGPPPPAWGTRIDFDDLEVAGDLLKVQDEFAAALAQEAPVPQSRRDHFAWLDQNENFRRHGGSIAGWYGWVTEIKARPGGGWLVEVDMRPAIHVEAYLRHRYVAGAVQETYQLLDGKARLIDTDAGPTKTSVQVFPIAY